MNFLVTGVAGFIGFHSARRLLAEGHRVVGIDNLSDYYDPALKQGRLDQLLGEAGFMFQRMDICDATALAELVADGDFDRVVHFAAQPGVRHAARDPGAYLRANLLGFGNLLEACRRAGTPHLVYASTSSVYGASTRVPYSEHGDADHPLSLYAATKRSNELMAHAYSALHGLPTTGLRMFTVYGPWGRPDMAPWLFTEAILAGRPIEVFNYGQHLRDFTYIDDIVSGVACVAMGIPAGQAGWDTTSADPAQSYAPFRLYNIGGTRPVDLNRFIATLESRLGRQAQRVELPLQAGDMPETWADCSDLERDYGYRPVTPLEEGINRFVDWYLDWQGRD